MFRLFHLSKVTIIHQYTNKDSHWLTIILDEHLLNIDKDLLLKL